MGTRCMYYLHDFSNFKTYIMAIRKAADFTNFKLIHGQQRLFSYSSIELSNIINETRKLYNSFDQQRNFAWFHATCTREINNEGNQGFRAQVYCPTIGNTQTPDTSGSLIAPCPTFCTNDSFD